MKVTVLIENATPSSRFIAKHGLSLFVETGERRVLFDMGPDDSFLRNAQALGVDVLAADTAIISHGHYDHGGGLGAYLEATGARGIVTPVEVCRGAFDRHVSGTRAQHHDIGLDPAWREHPRVREHAGDLDLGDGMVLFACPDRPHPEPSSNATLWTSDGTNLVRDAFAHEWSLLVREGARTILVAGCSHVGILNILERAEELAGVPVDIVVAGQHLTNPSGGTHEDLQTTRAVAHAFAERGTAIYTFHCTGLAAFAAMRDVLGPRITYLPTGAVLSF